MKEKTLKYAGTSIIVLLLITATITFVSNSKNKRNYNEEKIRNESISSQKLQVSQELEKVKNDMAALTAEKESDKKLITTTDSKLAEAEKRLAHMSKENSSLLVDRNDLVQLRKTKSYLDKAYEDLKLKQETASSRIKELENSTIILDAQKKELSENLADAEKYRTSNIEIYGSGGNKKDKLTFIARRTKKLNLIFDVPQNLNEPISIKIITPEGKTITPSDKTITSSIGSDINYLTASLSTILPAVPGNINSSQKVTIVYTPEEIFKAGEYKIQINSNGRNIGNSRLKLR
ncbi:MAG: hypothetical protein WA816_15775 [Bacteroidales bacterium]